MAGLIENLVYRISISAIVGAVVAGGVIYLSNEQVVTSYKASLAAQAETHALANAALMQANADLTAAINALETANATRFDELRGEIGALSAKVDAIPEVPAADYTVIIDAISTLNADITAQITDIDVQKQEP